MKNTFIASLITSLTLSTASFGSIILTFSDTGTFDQQGVGAFTNLTDGSYSFTLTTVDIIDGTKASEGAGHLTSIDGNGAFGINSAIGEASATNFDGGEAWEAVFSHDIRFDSITLASLDAGDSLFLTILDGSNEGSGTIVDLTISGYNAVDELITAGTHFTLQAGATSGSVRFTQIGITAIPEPATMGLFGIATISLLLLRKLKS